MNRTEAEEHLRVIRSLMEKATVYRAISAPTALVGGLASTVWGSVLAWRAHSGADAGAEALWWWFVAGWVVVLGLTGTANTYFLLREAKRREEPFVSAGMKMAMWSFGPPLFCGAVLSGFVAYYSWLFLPALWMIFYGLGLLATLHFAPRSIPMLGVCFVIAGLGSLGLLLTCDWSSRSLLANVLMAATFGVFHLIYAACTWPRAKSSEA